MSYQAVSNLCSLVTPEQQLCSCCQTTFAWKEDDDTEAAPTSLVCGHLLCAECVKSQWLNAGTHDDSVFCLICSKRVGILHLNHSDKEVDSKRNVEMKPKTFIESDNCKPSSSTVFRLTEEQMCKVETASDSTSLAIRDEDEGEWPMEQKDGIPLQEWVNSNMCDNFVLKLVTTGGNKCTPGNTTLVSGENSENLASGLIIPASANVTQDENSASAVGEESGVQSEEAMMGYIVNKSGLENMLVNGGFCNSTDNISVQANMIGSPDLNLKALLQMLEKNSDPTAGGSATQGNETHSDLASAPLDRVVVGTENDAQYGDVCSTARLDMEMLSVSEKPASSLVGSGDEWRPVDILQHEPTMSGKEKPLVSQPMPYALYVQNTNVVSVDEHGNYISLGNLPTHNSSMLETTRLNTEHIPNTWFSQINRDFPHKNNARPRRGRRRKPFLRHFQSEFFVRPYLKRERSPQLQLVKLVRQRAHDKLQEEKLPKVAKIHDEKSLNGSDYEKRSLENPELAFMKTVDMPSGKRVEDIYVVPSVWISNDKKNAGKASCSKEAMNMTTTNLCNYFPVGGHHGNRGPYMSSGTGPYFRQLHSTFSHYQPTPTHVQIPTRKSLHHSSTCESHTFRPTHSIYKVIRGHIITTLNAPKLEPVPSLKDLCKAVLGLRPNATYQHFNENNNLVLVNGSLPTSSSPKESSGPAKEPNSEIKTPKEFLDMQGAAAHHELKIPDLKVESGIEKMKCNEDEVESSFVLKERPLTEIPTFCNLPDTTAEDEEIEGSFSISKNQGGEKMSDTEETLPENPLFTDDIKVEQGKLSTKIPDMSEVVLQTKVIDLTQVDSKFQEQPRKYVPSRILKESVRNQMPTQSSTNNLKYANGEYVIPIVSYKLTDATKGNFLPSAKPNRRHEECPFPNSASGQRKFGIRPFSHLTCSSTPYSVFSEGQFSDEAGESNILSIPSLATITKQIRYLSSFEPLNKPLANLAAALNLLCNAEKTLCDSNFILYRQVKWENNSKLGHLNMCIRKIGDSIVSVGRTLQAWTKETNNRCFKTMGVLTDLYNSNIVALIELITPYFHYICELIASCHSDTVHWNKQVTSLVDPSSCLTDASQIKPLRKWQEAMGYSQPANSFLYSDTMQPSSPNDCSRHQDPEQSLSSEEMGEGESEASISGQTSRKTSPKVKLVNNAKRGRPPGSKNGQRKARICQPKSKPKERLSPMGCKRSASTFQDFKYGSMSVAGQQGMQLANTILVNMSAEKFWNEANATVLQEPPVSISHTVPRSLSNDTVTFTTAGHSIIQLPSTTASWILPMKESQHNVPVQLSVSQETDQTSLSLLDQGLTCAGEVPGPGSTEEPEGSTSDCSPHKKVKFEPQDIPPEANDYTNIVFAVPKGVSIVVDESNPEGNITEDAGTTVTGPTLDSINELTSCRAESFQNIFFIQGSESSDSYLQLDPQQLSMALIKTLKTNKEVQKRFELALMQGCQSVELREDSGITMCNLQEGKVDADDEDGDMNELTRNVHTDESIRYVDM